MNSKEIFDQYLSAAFGAVDGQFVDLETKTVALEETLATVRARNENLRNTNAELTATIALLEAELDALKNPKPSVVEPDPPVDPPVEPPVDELPNWLLQYSTDFTKNEGWTVYNNQTQNNDNSINLAKNVLFGPRGLEIWGKREGGYSRPFTSGEIVGRSTKLVVPNYYRAEVTGYFTDISGVWPCLLWFRPDNASNGEIDVMEWMGGMWTGDQKRVAITMHNEYGATQDSAKKPLILKNNPWFNPNVPHTYTIEKTPGKIEVWVDGRSVAVFNSSSKPWWNRIMEVKERTWYPRITLQIGEGSVTKVVPNPASSFTETVMGATSYKVWVPKSV